MSCFEGYQSLWSIQNGKLPPMCSINFVGMFSVYRWKFWPDSGFRETVRGPQKEKEKKKNGGESSNAIWQISSETDAMTETEVG